MFLPLWALEELQQCWGSVDIFSSTVTAELAELAFEFAGGVPRTVLQLPAQTANSSIPIRSFVVDILENAINRLPSEALQDTVNQILTVGLVGSNTLYTLALPRATVFEFEVVQDPAGKFVANSMDVYAQPKYNFPTFDALNCGSLWFQDKLTFYR
ncbi:hypothetical protein WJX77_001980 [Trebouxia sp. C0004]